MKLITWLVAIALFAVCGMGSIYVLQRRAFSRQLDQIELVSERQNIVQNLNMVLERYRRQSANFRRMSESDISSAKSKLKTEVTEGTTRLDQLQPTGEEQAWTQRLNRQLADFLVLSTKLEPMLFLRDVYQKPEAKAAHEAMLETIAKLRESAESHHDLVRANSQGQDVQLQRALVALGGSVFVLLSLVLIRVYGAQIRPTRQLVARAREVRSGKLRREKPSRLSGIHAEIEKAVDELASLVDSGQRERQHFVTAVATDLRVPLIPLQASANLIASVGDQLTPEQRSEASEVVRRSVVRLSRTLEDLTDTLQLERGEIALSDKIVDLRDVVTGASSVLSGAGASHDVRVFVPTMPIWALVDRQRMERVLINLVAKVMQYSPQGGAIDITLSRAVRGNVSSGVELTIHEGSNDKPGQARASGPEQDLLRHWISENGFGLALAQKIVEAHGGMITAAGIAGTSVIFTLRLPEERIANGMQGRMGFKTILSDGQKKDFTAENGV